MIPDPGVSSDRAATERANRMDAEANEGSAERDRLTAELEGAREELFCRSKLSTSWQVISFPSWHADNSPPKEQVKFNLGGTVVQVPTEILLKHERSKIAAITRSAMHVGDMAIPLPCDYEIFCQCVFYICNEKVHLPPSIRRKDFMKEMKYYGIPFDETLVSGGKCASPNTSTYKLHSSKSLPRQQQISPTTVTQLHYHAAACSRPRSSSVRPHCIKGWGTRRAKNAIATQSPLLR